MQDSHTHMSLPRLFFENMSCSSAVALSCLYVCVCLCVCRFSLVIQRCNFLTAANVITAAGRTVSGRSCRIFSSVKVNHSQMFVCPGAQPHPSTSSATTDWFLPFTVGGAWISEKHTWHEILNILFYFTSVKECFCISRPRKIAKSSPVLICETCGICGTKIYLLWKMTKSIKCY